MSSPRSGGSGSRTVRARGERRSRPVGEPYHDSVVGARRRAAEVEASDAGQPDGLPEKEHRRSDADRERGAADEACTFAVSEVRLAVHGFGGSRGGTAALPVCTAEETAVVAFTAAAPTASVAAPTGGTCDVTVWTASVACVTTSPGSSPTGMGGSAGTVGVAAGGETFFGVAAGPGDAGASCCGELGAAAETAGLEGGSVAMAAGAAMAGAGTRVRRLV